MAMTDGVNAAQAAGPNPAMIGIFVKVLFDSCEGWVAVREFPENGGANRAPNTPFFAAGCDLAGKLAAEADAAAKTGLALYVVAGTVSAEALPPDVLANIVSEALAENFDVQIDAGGAEESAHIVRELIAEYGGTRR